MIHAIRDCANFQVRSNADNEVKLYADYARVTSLDFASNQVYARSKNSRAVRFDDERQITFKTTFEVFDMEVIAMLFGKEMAERTIEFAKREVIPVKNGSATLVGTPKTGTLLVYKVDPKDKKSNILKLTVGDTTDVDKYTISGNKLTFNTSSTFAEDGFVACYYMVDTPTKGFTVDSVSFPGGYNIYGDTFIRDLDQNDTAVQFHLVNVKPLSQVSVNLDSANIATIEITWDAMANADGDMMTWDQIV